MTDRTLARGLLAAAALLAPLSAAVTQASVGGVVYDSLRTRAPLRGATVTLLELQKVATTDARGRFRIDSLPPGRFTVTFLHPVLDSLGVAAEVQVVTVPERGAVDVHLTTPSPATAYGRLCPGAHDVSTGVLFGVVRDVDSGAPIAGSEVFADWIEFVLQAGSLHGHVERVRAEANTAGVYRLCGVPADVATQVFAFADGHAAGPVLLRPESRLLARFDLSISRRDTAARLTVEELADSARRGAVLGSAPGSAAITGRVVGARGRPIRNALLGIGGTDLSTRSDSAGHFSLARVPAGTRSLAVRAIGLTPATFVLSPPTGATLDTVVTVEQNGQLLAEITVLAERAALVDRSGFAERARMGHGFFLAEAEIEKHPATDLYGFLTRIPGLSNIIQTGPRGEVVRQVLMHRASQGGAYCTPNYFLDGMFFPLDMGPEPLLSLSMFVQASNLKGIEVYQSAGSIPPQFDRPGSSSCGAVVIWTK